MLSKSNTEKRALSLASAIIPFVLPVEKIGTIQSNVMSYVSGLRNVMMIQKLQIGLLPTPRYGIFIVKEYTFFGVANPAY